MTDSEHLAPGAYSFFARAVLITLSLSEKGRAMRILWVKVGGLWPSNTGGRLRSIHMIAELSSRHRVTLLTTHGPGDDPEGLKTHLKGCERIVSIPHVLPKHGSVRFAAALLRSWFSPLPVDLLKNRVAALRRAACRLVTESKIDLCVADFLIAIPNVPTDGSVPVVLFAHNVEHMIWKRLWEVENKIGRRVILNYEWRKMHRYEARICHQVEMTLAVSEADRTLLAAESPGARVEAVPTGVDIAYFSPNGTPERPNEIVFTGSMDWYPNEEAVLYFMEYVLPQIRHEEPDATLTVVGRNPSGRLRAAADQAGVRVTGTVEDVRPYLKEAAVFVVPLRVGGGTRLKIFEALAMGKAVVSTTVGAEGLPLVSGEHFLQADGPDAFAQATLSLLRDPARRRAMGRAGRKLVEDRYSWSKVTMEFERKCQEVFHNDAN